jgi:hypothetical protein
MNHAKIVTILIWIASFIIALPTVFVQVSNLMSGIKGVK